MVLTFALVLLAAEPSKLSDPPEPAPPPPPAEPRSFPITPVQGDLSASFGIGDPRGPYSGALYLGGALGWTTGDGPDLFFGGGVELVYATSDDPYRISLGGQLRGGLAWARQRGYDRVAIPDLLVFLRLTAFGAGSSTRVTNPMGVSTISSSTFFGFRAGVGVTALWPARTFIDNFPLVDVDGLAGEVLKVVTTLVLFPILLLNHAEVAFEYAFSPRPVTAVLLRVGTGF
jgi:hypothetical protein